MAARHRRPSPGPGRATPVGILAVAMVVGLAGCSAVLPANPPPADIPPQPPQFVCETAWDVPNGTVTVTIETGARVTLDPGASIAVRGDIRRDPVYWVSGAGGPDAAQDGSLGPGDRIRVDLESLEDSSRETEVDVTVVWTAGDSTSAGVCGSDRLVGGSAE